MVSYDHTIPPGGKGKITLKVSTRNRHGNLVKRALVMTNDYSKKYTTIALKAEVKPIISIEPRPYVFLTGLPDEKITKEIRLVAEDVPRFTVKKLTDTLKNKVSYELTTIKKGKEYVLRITNNYHKVGTYYGEINLETDTHEKPTIRIRVSGRIRGELVALPRMLYFGQVPSESPEANRPLTREILVRNVKKKPFHIKALDYDKKLFNIKLEPSEDKSSFRLKVTPQLAQMKKGNHYSLLKIKTDVSNSPELMVGLRVYVR